MARKVCDPLDASTWPAGYICVDRDGSFVLEPEGSDDKKACDPGNGTPWGSVFIGAGIGIAAGLFFSNPSNRKIFK